MQYCQRFIREHQYLLNISPRTNELYKTVFDGCPVKRQHTSS